MAKIKAKLTHEEMMFVKSNEASIKSIINILDMARQFKVGDFLIAYKPDPYAKTNIKKYYTNSYGVVRKYTVVLLDGLDIPYMKEINKKGNPCGKLISPIQYDSYHNRFNLNNYYAFQVDPGFEDAILLGEDASYKVNELHVEKSDIFKEVAAHNKKYMINTDTSNKDLFAFFKTLKTGDTLWRNRNSSLTILDCSNLKNKNSLIKFQSSRGAIIEIAIWEFFRTRLYSERPRPFKEGIDLK
jgi:hypothetical protein